MVGWHCRLRRINWRETAKADGWRRPLTPIVELVLWKRFELLLVTLSALLSLITQRESFDRGFFHHFPFAFSPEPLFREARRVFGRPRDCDGVAVQSRKSSPGAPKLTALAIDHRPPVSIARRSNGVRSFLPLRPFQQRSDLSSPSSADCLRSAQGSCSG